MTTQDNPGGWAYATGASNLTIRVEEGHVYEEMVDENGVGTGFLVCIHCGAIWPDRGGTT